MDKKPFFLLIISLLVIISDSNVNAIKCELNETTHIDIPYSIDNKFYYVGIKQTTNSSFLVAYNENCNFVDNSIAEKVFETHLINSISSGIGSLQLNLTTSEDFKKGLEQIRTVVLYTETGSNFLRPTISFVDDVSPYIQKVASAGSKIDVVIRWSELQAASKELQDGRILSYSGLEEYKETCGRFVASGLSAFLVTQVNGIKKLGPIFIQSFYGVTSTQKAKGIASNTKKFMNNYPEAYEAVIFTLEGTKQLASKTANKFCYPFIDAPAKVYAKEMELQLNTGKGIKKTTGDAIVEGSKVVKEESEKFFEWIINLIKNFFSSTKH